MSAVIKPAHRAVLSYNTVFNIIHTAVGLLYLIVNFPFHACQILRMYHTAEWIMHLLPELLYRFTAKQTDCTRIGIEQFFFAHCAIDKKPSDIFASVSDRYTARLSFLPCISVSILRITMTASFGVPSLSRSHTATVVRHHSLLFFHLTVYRTFPAYPALQVLYWDLSARETYGYSFHRLIQSSPYKNDG